MNSPNLLRVVFRQDADRREASDWQGVLNNYFHAHAAYWAEIYQRDGVHEAIHIERLRTALAMASALEFGPAARALDVGCGAGFATVGLAKKGFTVEAVDPLRTMVDTTRQRAKEAGLDYSVTARTGDIHALPFPDQAFDLVVALGVMPWLLDVRQPLREISRVLRPGGYMIVSIDTRWQLRQVFDPVFNPVLHWPRQIYRRIRGVQKSASHAVAHVVSRRAFRHALEAEGFDQIGGNAIGFGPFTVLRREMLPSSWSLMLNNFLQRLANNDVPLFRSSGSQHLLLARKRRSERDAAEHAVTENVDDLRLIPLATRGGRNGIRATMPH